MNKTSICRVDVYVNVNLQTRPEDSSGARAPVTDGQILRASHMPGNMERTNIAMSIWPVSKVASAGPGQ